MVQGSEETHQADREQAAGLNDPNPPAVLSEALRWNLCYLYICYLRVVVKAG